jgi:F-type H+-transporting ATPase subunit gamma
MRRVPNIKKELEQTLVIEDLTQVFESIASMHIARIRDKVVASKSFFGELWQIYAGLRVNSKDRLKRGSAHKNGKTVLVAITSEAKFGSSTHDHVLEVIRSAYPDDDKTDIMAIGTYGSSWLERHGVSVKQAFTMPSHDTDINVSQAIDILGQYEHITVFYQTYDSLRVQKVSRIDLVSTVRQLGEDVGDDIETISSADYIFEPGVNEIADYMESVMMSVALLQVIMEAKLADYAIRFNNMSMAKQRAGDMVNVFQREFYRARRADSDERLKEIIKVVHGSASSWAN